MIKTNVKFWKNLGLAMLLLTVLYQISGLSWQLQIGKYFYLAKFSNFVDKVEINYLNYEEKQWNAANRDFDKLSHIHYKKYHACLDQEEIKLVNGLKGRYRALQIKYYARKGIEELKNLKDQFDVFMEEVTSDP